MPRMKAPAGIVNAAIVGMMTKYENLINDRSWSFARTSELSFEELQSEARCVAIRTIHRYLLRDQETDLTTWLHRNITQQLVKFKHKNPPTTAETEYAVSQMQSYHGEWRPDRMCKLNDDIKALTDEAGYVARIFLTAPAEILDIGADATVKSIRGKLRRHLSRDMGWSKSTIQKVLGEIREMVRNL